MNGLEINKELVLSTAHIPEYIADNMNLGVDVGVPYDKLECGYLVYAMSPIEQYPLALFDAVRLARQHECKWIHFDCDGPELDSLPAWHW